MLTPDDLRRLAAILEGTDVASFDVETPDYTVSLRRRGDAWVADERVTRAPRVVDEPAPDAAGGSPASSDEVEAGEGQALVRAPLPGTFYRAPQPGAPPFVEVGSRVTADTTVGIVETMKMMTPVAAGATGVVARILVDNGGAVEQDGALVLIEAGE